MNWLRLIGVIVIAVFMLILIVAIIGLSISGAEEDQINFQLHQTATVRAMNSENDLPVPTAIALTLRAKTLEAGVSGTLTAAATKPQ